MVLEQRSELALEFEEIPGLDLDDACFIFDIHDVSIHGNLVECAPGLEIELERGVQRAFIARADAAVRHPIRRPGSSLGKRLSVHAKTPPIQNPAPIVTAAWGVCKCGARGVHKPCAV